jgi:hypothetical protein
LQYERRRPEDTILHRVLREHWQHFVALAEQAERWVPSYVQREVERYLECGILAHGFARVHCAGCGYDRLVAFSCKGRSLCGSCGGRRMADTAAHLVDRVIPAVPMRQWVLTVPPPLRYRLAYDKELMRLLLRCCSDVLFGWLRYRAKEKLGLQSVRDAHPGAITFVQRFGSALNLNVHLHSLLTDGVFVHRSDDWHPPRFVALPPPSREDQRALAWQICERLMRKLRDHGESLDVGDDRLRQDEPLLADCFGASVQGLVATGPRAGQRVMRFIGASPSDGSQRVIAGFGFDLHAEVAVPAHDRKRLEQLCRYAARPALSAERLTETSSGKLAVELKRPWSDGTTHVLFSPHELIEKLVALIPPPRQHMVRYSGVFAPNAKLRPLIVPRSDEDGCRHPRQLEMFDEAGQALPTADSDAPRPRRLGWAKLMARVFAIDVLKCPRCNSRMQVIAWVTSHRAIREILRSVGLPTAPPSIQPAHYQQLKLDFAA